VIQTGTEIRKLGWKQESPAKIDSRSPEDSSLIRHLAHLVYVTCGRTYISAASQSGCTRCIEGRQLPGFSVSLGTQSQVASELEPLRGRITHFTARCARAKYRGRTRASASFRDAKLSSDVECRMMILIFALEMTRETTSRDARVSPARSRGFAPKRETISRGEARGRVLLFFHDGI